MRATIRPLSRVESQVRRESTPGETGSANPSGSALPKRRAAPYPAMRPIDRVDSAAKPEEERIFPRASRELAEQRRKLAPKQAEAFKAFSQSVFAEGALSAKIKQLIAVAVAHVTQCPYCIRGHTKAALQSGATAEEILEAVWVAAEMRAGAAYAHSALALDEIAHVQSVNAKKLA
jgi:AhpD family alkylhydroperoxidase